MVTEARLEGGEWVLNGAKRWIGLASIAQVAVIWAKTEGGVRGFVVPTDTPGFTATAIEPKLSMRASIQCDIELADIRLPEGAVLPGVVGLKGPFSCLNEARYGIAGFQLTQQKLVNWALEIQKAQLLALRLGRLKDAGRLEHHMISVAKLNNTRIAIDIAREARGVLGGNGITLDYSPLRHANNLESVRTYEGTDEVHTLILGERITGLPAFR
jgi:glutaryl-CoA dehydrogenase